MAIKLLVLGKKKHQNLKSQCCRALNLESGDILQSAIFTGWAEINGVPLG